MLISVILPCYNVEKYIDRCLGSIVKQTIGVENLEIICVDDCSTDGTLDKLRVWESEFPDNIMVISYERNLRQGGARNVGLQYCSSDYIGFVDSDDWIEVDMYRDLYERMKTGDYDLVSCKYIRDNGDAVLSLGHEDAELFFDGAGGYCWCDLTNVGGVGDIGGITTKLFKKSVVFDNEIWFPEGLAYEDNYWLNVYYLYTSKMYVIDKIYYHYWVNTDSTVMQKNEVYHFDRLSIEEQLICKYKELGVFELFYANVLWDFLQRYYLGTMFLYFTRFDYCQAKVFNYMKHKIFSIYPNLRETIRPIFSSALDDKNKLLLSALLLDGDMTDEELYALKIKYIN